MAEKDNKPKTTAKPAAKPAVAKPTATVKPAAKPAATVKPVEKPTAPVKPAAKPAATVKPATKPAATAAPKPAAPTAKPAPAPEVKKETAVAAAAPAKPKKAAATAEKPEKQPKEKPAKAKKDGGSGKGSFVAALSQKNIKFIIMAAVAFVLIIALVIGIVVGTKSCKKSDDTGIPDFGDLTVTSVASSHNNKTQVGYSGEILGTVARYKPVEGEHAETFSAAYPAYGSTRNLTTEQKNELILLNRQLTANGTWVDVSKKTTGSYDMMDKDGYLYKTDGTKPGNGVPERLYKHTASVGMYGGNVADNEPAVVKKLTIRPRSYGGYYSVTGLYAPAGEVIKIQLSDADMKATSGLTIHIGQALYNGQANNIWAQRGVNRMPIILNTMNITESTATYDEETGLWTGYVGSFLGGPIYVRSESPTFSVTISGGVNYAHFILGVTTEEEYNVYKKSSAPYFDLEVWDRGVLHSGPVRKVKNYSYQDLYKAAILWEKIALVSTQNGTNQGIVFLYDPFVAAGAAVAFPGRRSVNCPEGWITGSLNYNAFVTSGSWGNVHEYNHNFQNYGYGSGADGEVTNNGLNLVAYSLFTKISSARGISGFGGAGLSGWNRYTSASWVLSRVNANSIGSTNGLAVYATLLHNFGQDAYLSARGSSGAAYLNKWQTITHNDMRYYAEITAGYRSLSPDATNYPLFVPVSSVYQTGRTYQYAEGDKREITTMQPYVIPYGKPFTVDLRAYTNNSAGQYESGSIVVGKGFKCSIKNVTADGINGTFEETDTKGVYTFTPNSTLRSGKIYVTLEITADTTTDIGKKYASSTVNDVDLVLEFQQSQEHNKNILERTIYTYDESTYTSATQAYENGYEGYASVETKDNKNYSQNSNTDIWLYNESYKDNPTYGQYVYPANSVMEIKGKLYFPQDGKYRIYMRGRVDCALYLSKDGGKTYFEAVHIDRNDNIGTSAVFHPEDERTYYDIEIDKDETWIYFKEVMIVERVQGYSMMSFVGLGMAQWVMPTYTAEVQYYFEVNGNRTNVTEQTTDDGIRYYYDVSGTRHYVESNGRRYYYNKDGELIEEGNVGYILAETTYYDGAHKVVSAEEASNADYTPPTTDSVTKNPPYVTAYREPYEFQKEFESDYFITRSYNYNYVGDPVNYSTWDEGATLVATNYKPESKSFPIDNIFKEGQETYIHPASNGGKNVFITLDMGKEITANSITFLGRTDRAASLAQQGLPKNFTLEISMDGETYEDAGSYTNGTGAAYSATINLGKNITFRYIRITVKDTNSNTSRLILSGIKFTYAFKLDGNGNNHFSPDDTRFTYKGDWKLAQTLSTFGHVYVGSKGAEMSFDYDAQEGGRFAILSSNKYGQNYEVYIDGTKVESINVKDDAQEFAIRYITPALSEGKHKVVIKCTGEANIDSIAFY